MTEYTIEKRVWQHPSPRGREDFRGQERYCVVDEFGDVCHHFGSHQEARAYAERLKLIDAADDLIEDFNNLC